MKRRDFGKAVAAGLIGTSLAGGPSAWQKISAKVTRFLEIL